MSSKIVFILGDVHGDFEKLNEFIDVKIRSHPAIRALAEDSRRNGGELEVLILQCGDMAYFWPRKSNLGQIRNNVSFLKNGRVNIYRCAGNHEDHDQLDALFSPGSEEDRNNIAQIDEGIFFCRFGATLKISPEITALFAGGAESVDHMARFLKMCQGYHKIWWTQESISEADIARLDTVKRADWIISHTSPMCFGIEAYLAGNPWSEVPKDNTSMIMLDRVFAKYCPKRWFFGHFHIHALGKYENCEWECLADMQSQEKFYTIIKL